MPTRILRRCHAVHPSERFPRRDGGNFMFGPGGQVSVVQDPLQQDPLGTNPQSQGQGELSFQPAPISFSLPSGISSLVEVTPSPSEAPLSPTPIIFTSTQFVISSFPSVSSSDPAAPSSFTSTATASSSSTGTETTSAPPSATPSNTPTSSAVVPFTSVAAPSETANDSTNISNHSPPFYIGIVLGTIVVIACIAALVASCFRLRTRLRRYRDFAAARVPWGNRNDEELEEARNTDFIGSGPLTIGGMARGEKGMEVWEPLGDRDVGIPRKADSSPHTPVSPVKRSTMDPLADTYRPFDATYASRGPLPTLADSVAFPLPPINGPYPTPRPLPPHLRSSDFSVPCSSHSLGPLQVANMMPGDATLSRSGSVTRPTNDLELGTPREQVPGSRPRFWGLEGNGLKVPWAQPCPGPDICYPKHRPPTPALTEPSSWIGNEGWTASLKSNLVNAFNAVASNLTVKHAVEEDHLTPVPHRKFHRLSVHDAGWGEHVDGTLVAKPPKRQSTVCSTSSSSSKAWTLEETGDGVGIVHIRGLPNHGGGDHKILPEMGTEYGPDHWVNRSTTTIHSQTPLIITKKPPAALLKTVSGSKLHPSVIGALSRASSVYSTASATSSVLALAGGGSRPPQLPSLPPFPRTITMRSREAKSTGTDECSTQPRLRPGSLSRTSSSNSSETISEYGRVESILTGERMVRNAKTKRRE